MRITLIITDYGSFNNFLAETAIELLNSGHNIDVICSKIKVIKCEDKFNFEQLGIVFHYVDFPRGFGLIKHFIASRNIHKVLSEINPDIVNIHFTTGIFTTLLTGKPRAYSLGTFHGINYPIINNFLKRTIFKIVEHFCFKKLDKICVINKFDYNLLNSRYKNKLIFINSNGLGCDLDKFNKDRFSREAITQVKHRLKIDENDFVIAFTGRFVKFKGFDLVVKSFIRILEDNSNSNMKLILIGDRDPIHKTGLTKKEENWIETNNHVINVGFTSEVEKYLSVTDLFVFPSVKEGMPVCIIEALSMGIPVITTNSRGCNDLIINGFNGLLLSCNPSIEEIIIAISKLKNDRTLMSFLKSNILNKRECLCRTKFVREQVALLTEN